MINPNGRIDEHDLSRCTGPASWGGFDLPIAAAQSCQSAGTLARDERFQASVQYSCFLR
jgi:hypothetical protein